MNDKLDLEELGFFTKSTSVNVLASVYALVFGDGDLNANLEGNRVAPYKVIRRFDEARQKPTIVTDGKPTVFYGARPTFTWTMGDYNTYTAFKLQIRDTAGKIVYDSGDRLAPIRDSEGNYTWSPDVYVDDLCNNGSAAAVFSNTNQYTWRVQMSNSKYGVASNGWSNDSPEFRMNVNVTSEVNDSGYSSVKACVKYFGPAEVLADVRTTALTGKIRVEAYSTADFTGEPVARGYFSGEYASLTNDDYSANVLLKGVPSGSYYIRAYIDSDGDIERDSWESWGYANRRDLTSGRNIFTPVPVTVGPDVAAAPLARVYIEDVDTDGDWLPDAWEWETSNGSLTAKGPGEFFDKNVFGFAENFQKRFTRMSASGSKVAANVMALSSDSLKSASMTALLLGIDTTGYSSSSAALSAAISPELVENGVVIESLSVADGKVTIKIGIETSAAELPDSTLYTAALATTLDVTCNVYVKENLASDEWTLAKSEKVTVGGEAVEIDAGESAGASGFYKVEVVK